MFLTVRTGSLPVLALMVAIPFAIYGALKKKITLTAQTSLFMETLWMTPLALAFSGWWTAHQGGTAAVLGDAALWLLPASGVVTSVPLLLFNLGVREIPYYFSGILMYINPTLQFLVGLLYFGEALQVDQLIAFVIIWAGISVTMVEKGRRIRRRERPGRRGRQGDNRTGTASPRVRLSGVTVQQRARTATPAWAAWRRACPKAGWVWSLGAKKSACSI